MSIHPRHPFRRLLRANPRPRQSRTKPEAVRPGGIDYARLQMPALDRKRLELRELAGQLRMQAATARRCGDHAGAEEYLREARARELQADAEDPTIEITADQAEQLETLQ